MKILQLTVHYSPNIGGVETHLSDLVNGLLEKGYEVFVLTYLPLTAMVKARIWEKGKHLYILRLPWVSGLFYKLVKSPILEFIYLSPLLFIITPLVLLLFRPDVIHSHGLIAGFIGVFWGKIFGIRTIVTTHSIYHFPELGFYRELSKLIFKNSSKILTLSKQSKREIGKLGIDDDKIVVFTYWVDLKKFRKIEGAKKKLGWNNKFVILFVGRLVEEKGVLVLLESIKSWNKNITLVIAGTGPLENKINHQVLSIKNLIYLGKLDNDKLPLYYSAADLVIIPSIHEEGFGRVILESLACGTPVIAANRGAIPEAMNETVGALIDITPKNITSKVNYYFKNQNKSKKQSKNAVVFAKKRYSANNIQIILNIYGKTT